ncbi:MULTISPECIES: C40 family peptidase [Paenibacillus]|uniref:C40 family peptidase n=1 Tax=Paenibacillus TaxID=44249 RepID=UPI00203BC34E|nr:C40 family peptidase [Paenibacillus camelliae]MCM3632827.1 C40 family peptidase [Paenibacillus camelliae]
MKMNKSSLIKIITVAGVCLTVAFSGISATPSNTNTAYAATSSSASSVIATGKKYLGVPYVFGAKSGITSAFDCSSFTQYVFKKNGISLPRNSRQQSKVGKYVSKSNLKAGDLIFSDTNRDGVINHVSIYMGNNKLLHTYSKKVGVTISTFKGSSWDKTYVTARRVLK